ncbi:AlbA family DNA-binding domain-containing protein [Bradyrhizobium archetypum]|uniref:ATP-binding protein n=1 Tax=Bradyrhizobium archetypum TaxID=2721160 RepID=A0A7Y4M3D1_9BRAD|nr:ATP-binding protein [Bradyrhizobium archetypum]NOJ48346.1 ATP-binding protein [Bradyrhizobium archetypum]
MDLLSNDIHSLTAADILAMCADQVAEGATLELKSDLPSNDGKGKDPWHRGGRFSDYARNSLAREIVAFANTFGGALVLGINETKEKPSRAESPNPIPRIHELERSLRQALQDIIDPPLPILESKSIGFDNEGNGVIIFRVPTSRRRPHRVDASRDAFIRRMDESVRISMREIQELTIQNLSETRRIEDTIGNMRAAFGARLHDWLRVNGGRGAGFQLIALPTSPIDLGRVAGRPSLVDMSGEFVGIGENDTQYQLLWPFGAYEGAWTPGLRRISTSRGTHSSDALCEYSLTTQAVCELALFTKLSGFFAGWLTGALSKMLLWINRIRIEAGASGVEFAMAPQVAVIGQEAQLGLYGARNFGSYSDEKIPIGFAEFPIMSIGDKEEFPTHLMQFDEDLWNLVGKDFQRSPIRFQLMNPS